MKAPLFILFLVFLLPLYSEAQVNSTVLTSNFSESLNDVLPLPNGHTLIASAPEEENSFFGIPRIQCFDRQLELVWQREFPELYGGWITQMESFGDRIFVIGRDFECDISLYYGFYGFDLAGNLLPLTTTEHDPNWGRFTMLDDETALFTGVSDYNPYYAIINVFSNDTLRISDFTVPAFMNYDWGRVYDEDLVVLPDTSILHSGAGLQYYCLDPWVYPMGNSFTDCTFEELDDTIRQVEASPTMEGVAILGSNRGIYSFYNYDLYTQQTLPAGFRLLDMITHEGEFSILLANDSTWVVQTYDANLFELVNSVTLLDSSSTFYNYLVYQDSSFLLVGEREVELPYMDEGVIYIKNEVVLTQFPIADPINEVENFDVELNLVNTTYTTRVDSILSENRCWPRNDPVEICTEEIELVLTNHSSEVLNEITINLGAFAICHPRFCYYAKKYDSTFFNLSVLPGEQLTLNLSPQRFPYQTREDFRYCVWTTAPNGHPDQVESNDRICVNPTEYEDKPTAPIPNEDEPVTKFHYFGRQLVRIAAPTEQPAPVKIYNATGQLIFSGQLQDRLSLSLSPGYYVASIQPAEASTVHLPFVYW